MFQWEKEHLVGVSTVPNISESENLCLFSWTIPKFIWIVRYHQKRYNPAEWLYWGNDWRQSWTDTDLSRIWTAGSSPFLSLSEFKLDFVFLKPWTQTQNISNPCGISLSEILGQNLSRRVSRILFKMSFHYCLWVLWNMFLWMVLHHQAPVRHLPHAESQASSTGQGRSTLSTVESEIPLQK